MAGRLDALLKLNIVAAAMFASGSVGYYYLMYLPQRDAQLDAERALENSQAEADKKAVQEQAAAEQRALEQRQAAEKAEARIQYQNCLTAAEGDYNANWAAECRRISGVNTKGYDNCISGGLPKQSCLSVWTIDPSSNCVLPHTIATSLTGALDKARDRCLQETKAGLQ